MTIRRIFTYTIRTITKNWIAFNGNVLKPLAKSVLIPLELTVAAPATDAAIPKKMFKSGRLPSDSIKRTILIISNKDMNDIMKIVESEAKELKMRQKNKKADFSVCY